MRIALALMIIAVVAVSSPAANRFLQNGQQMYYKSVPVVNPIENTEALQNGVLIGMHGREAYWGQAATNMKPLDYDGLNLGAILHGTPYANLESYFSIDGGTTWGPTGTVNPGGTPVGRYPSMVFNKAVDIPWVISNSAPSPSEPWVTYDLLGYNGGAWVPPAVYWDHNDPNLYNYFTTAYFWEDGLHGYSQTHWTWHWSDMEGVAYVTTTDGGATWSTLDTMWYIDTVSGGPYFIPGYVSQGGLIGGHNGTAYYVVGGLSLADTVEGFNWRIHAKYTTNYGVTWSNWYACPMFTNDMPRGLPADTITFTIGGGFIWPDVCGTVDLANNLQLVFGATKNDATPPDPAGTDAFFGIYKTSFSSSTNTWGSVDAVALHPTGTTNEDSIWDIPVMWISDTDSRTVVAWPTNLWTAWSDNITNIPQVTYSYNGAAGTWTTPEPLWHWNGAKQVVTTAGQFFHPHSTLTFTDGQVPMIVGEHVADGAGNAVIGIYYYNVWDPAIMGVEGDSPVAPSTFALEQNRPNPFNPTTVVAFSLERASNVRLEVYNVLGQKVASLIDGNMTAGRHEVTWDAAGAASGVYFARLSANGETANVKMNLVK